jgi:hypothetical protein
MSQRRRSGNGPWGAGPLGLLLLTIMFVEHLAQY